MKINFGGKERGFQWGMGCLENYCDLMDCDLEGLELAFMPGRGQNKAIVNLLMAAMRNYSELNDEAVDFNYAKIQSWLDDAPQDTLAQLIQDFKRSKYLGRTIEDYFSMNEVPDTGVKKK